ncbi:DUF2637 domain-containing protein [Myceligenerans salitolerans]|uniref:DUF2637 domain-containing protein n=1 Tax=Myceligenerans salitolerans TaxID=1230528 RepID=A0ABS3I8U1_9MICO|nr:DUF2637 domain-containing protein [Myceligenerans salitolerans]MBO0609447.1 DUF2637 domain-containing protein [Myceligenerans salitolerans]
MTRTPAGPVARIAADSRPVLVFTVALTVAVALASFALSFASLRDAATWGRVPGTLAFLVPVVIDASVLVYGLVALVLRARGRSSAWAWTLMLGFTVVSIGANAAHAYDVPEEVKVLVGVVLVALAPLSVLTSTHALASLVVADEPVPAAEPITAPEPVSVGVAEVAPAADPEPVPAIAAASEASTPAVTDPEPAPASESAPAVEPAPVLAPLRSSSRPARPRVPAMQQALPGLEMSGVTA